MKVRSIAIGALALAGVLSFGWYAKNAMAQSGNHNGSFVGHFMNGDHTGHDGNRGHDGHNGQAGRHGNGHGNNGSCGVFSQLHMGSSDNNGK